jgi:hypothetical protein
MALVARVEERQRFRNCGRVCPSGMHRIDLHARFREGVAPEFSEHDLCAFGFCMGVTPSYFRSFHWGASVLRRWVNMPFEKTHMPLAPRALF